MVKKAINISVNTVLGVLITIIIAAGGWVIRGFDSRITALERGANEVSIDLYSRVEGIEVVVKETDKRTERIERLLDKIIEKKLNK